MVRRELLVALAVVILIGLSSAPAASRRDSHIGDFEVLATIVKDIEDSYAEEIDPNVLFYGALRGMLSVLDRHTMFLSPGEMDDLRLGIRGEFGGLGIEISIRDQWLTVISPIDGTPAFNAGVSAGDKILEIDGISTEGITLREAVNTLRGKPGTAVTITVLHTWSDDTEEIVVIRAKIKVPGVRGFERGEGNDWKYMVDEENKIGYLRLASFRGNSPEAVRDVCRKLLADGMRAMVFDLRFNPGGVLNAAVDISNLFISEGLIVETRGRVPTENVQFNARVEGTLPDFPMVILVNEGSASASEIVAGALQDHGRATIVGERSYGKGSVQRVKSVKDIMERRAKKRGGGRPNPSDFLDCGLKITTARYYTPKGRTFDRGHASISARAMKEFVGSLKNNTRNSMSDAAKESEKEKIRGGIIPDVEVNLTDEERGRLARSRRKAHIIHSPKEEKTEGKEEEEEGDEEGDEEGGEEEEEFVDRQLEEALKILREKLAAN